MSHPYPTPPTFGAQHPHFPYFLPSTNPGAGQPTQSLYKLPHLNGPSNVNLQPTVSASPHPQQHDPTSHSAIAPSFPYNPLDPDIFKHFAASNLLPPPPPNFGSFPPPGVSPLPFQQQNLNGFDTTQRSQIKNHYSRAEAQPSQPVSYVPSHVLANTFGDAEGKSNLDRASLMPAQIQPNDASRLLDQTQDVQYDGTDPSITGPHFMPELPALTDTDFPTNGNTKATEHLHDQAKEAISILASIGITFHDFITEGINLNILETLYSELDLNKHLAKRDSTTIGKGSSVSSLSTPRATDSVNHPTSTKSAVERKDRIAQLLAAKRGQASPIRPTSTTPPVPSQSKLSVVTEDAQSVAKSGVESQRNEERIQQVRARHVINNTDETGSGLVNIAPSLSSAAAAAAQLNALPSSIAKQSILRSLPMPVQTQIGRGGLSSVIPGLFMTSADSFEEEKSASCDTASPIVESLDESELLTSIRTLNPSLKRTNDELPLPQAKRRVSEMDEVPEVEMDLSNSDVEMSDGEITGAEIDQETSASPISTRKLVQQTQIPLLNESQGSRTGPVSASTPVTEATASNLKFGASPKAAQATDAVQPSPRSQRVTPTLDRPSRALMSSPGERHVETPFIATPERTLNTATPAPRSKVNADQVKARMAALKADLLRKRAMKETPPASDIDIQATRTKLTERKCELGDLQTRLQRLEAEIAETRQSERELKGEMQSLEQQISEYENSFVPQSNDMSRVSSREVDSPSLLKSALPTNTDPEQTPTASGPAGTDVGVMSSSSDRKLGVALLSNQHLSDTQKNIDDGLNIENSSHHNQKSNGTERSADQIQSGSVVETVTDYKADHDANRQTTSASPSATNERFATKSASAGMGPQESHSPESMDLDSDEASDSGSDGSASMSDSASEDYEPAEPDALLSRPLESEDLGDYEPQETKTAGANTFSDGEADEFEPSEDAESVCSRHPGNAHGAIDQSSAVSSAATTRSSTNERGVLSPSNAPQPDNQVSASPLPKGQDDREQANQLTEADSLIKVSDVHEFGDEERTDAIPERFDPPSSARFVPYHSPLTAFKSFRFNPKFSELVKDGYRSLTYSNKIDPSRPLCPTELAGQTCNDPYCEEQHFGTMALSDDKILMQMSSANDIPNKEQRDNFLIGLKQVIAGLRLRKVKEFSEVADALSKYRREWLTAQEVV